MSTVISVENVSKAYRLGQIGGGTLKDDIARWWARLRGKPDPLMKIGEEHHARKMGEQFWALDNVSFEVKQGEVLGIIGRNGAGKSTLLKILSQVTSPTSGRIKIKGRIASLLEVGTGFHAELTGRENIFLNGAILGMTKAEIRKKFDEIVDFSGVEQFIDTPVKRYSSGMYVRLAFAVAAHLEPEILIVDEVLAVGDAGFQNKCLGKMQEVSKWGRTILFVSHDMRKVTKLCSRGILLNSGEIEVTGDMVSVAATYLGEKSINEAFADLSVRGDRSGNGEAQFRSIELLKAGQRTKTFAFGDAVTQKIVVQVRKRFGASLVAIVITSGDGIPVHELWNVNERCKWTADEGIYEFSITIPKLYLYPGTYSVDLWLGNESTARVDYITGAIAFHVVQARDCNLERPLDRSNGIVFQSSDWNVTKLASI